MITSRIQSCIKSRLIVQSLSILRTLIQAFESKTLDLHDFYFTGDDYRYRFELNAKRRFIQVVRERFNFGVVYKGRVLKWDTVIQEKTSELARFVSGRFRGLDFSDPTPILERTDNPAIREAILRLSQSEARKHGIGKSTLHYLRKNASRSSFRIRRKTLAKLRVE
jgi:hypothetical protein